ncbi:MAG: outer membrane beta-barrel protein [Flavobacteriales bacterium]|nr:outer membrane beta-barrel protein [Flavobacteriales bacterium]
MPERAPWEISIMGGMFSSTTKYAGSNSADWNADIGKENSIGIGAELMHMGRNFGIGTGLHYSTYAERLHTDAVDRNTMTLQNFWYLMPVDTMVLVITDTIAGTPPTYTGTSENTTVHVLTQGTDTTTTTERIREARNELSRVSYIEVPLLLDAHLVQGRWSFGLRGGPTLGLLTGRRGTVPAPDNEGYVNFTDQPFRELVFGYTARAYIRYRFNAAWSVGIEPAMRGQLMNSLGSGDLDRKANSKGVMLSLSYRLR